MFKKEKVKDKIVEEKNHLSVFEGFKFGFGFFVAILTGTLIVAALVYLFTNIFKATGIGF
ncbi:hypothetical protein AUK11_04525 [bacterium CG2_30_37_16]|nr:MAG: hypothetical protein AUK11_04525 [bacterium CG2_30_37_16]PIP30764.1 MAG: hypothetical protein COX25_02995 [bacterium (Candidatus Howlettbacteria) CG23_combo_of_CG06-09_8_20_14_all_37_9]PIX98785.1 MAG: hypothetical protein COZ22_04160 [bacterium (Candidatus Howlettbacteria) CG_4_10_14_3_um_filter_37_10]PJB05487.1 MAG: hypothetical protein CO123_04010 [bacterium (Candidatus Howlettbacteria) CG_4_9_14_3_um_filter_37_10]